MADAVTRAAAAEGQLALERQQFTAPWTELQQMKGDRQTIERIAEAEKLLKSLRKALSS